MMDLETMLRIGAIVIAALLLLPLMNMKAIIVNLFSKLKKAPVLNTKVAKKDKDFLHIIDLWFQLKAECNTYGLDEAVDKLDEVFPLLNIENRDV